MPRYTITESVGSSVQNVRSFEDLEKHHPSSGREPGRDYETIAGELEEVRYRDNKTFIKKDFILSQEGGGAVNIPAPATGYIHYLNDSTNAVRIYDKPFGTPGAVMLAQSLHMERGTSPPEGSKIEYGQPMGRMGDTGSPGSVHAHVEAPYDQFKKYIEDIVAGRIQSNGAVNVDPLKDGKLQKGEYGDAVEKLQKALNAAGARDAEGKELKPDKDFGDRTKQAVEDYQRKNNLPVTGIADEKMLQQLGVTGQQQTQPTQPQPQPTQPQTPAEPQKPTEPQQPTGGRPSGGPTDFGSNNVLGALISSGEGNYNSFNRGRAGDSGGKEIDFSQMTVAEVMRRQDLPNGDPNRLFAVGKYQVIPGTMEEAVKALNIDPNQKFTPQLQERIFADYLIDEKRPSVRDYITGKTGPEGLGKAQLALAQEFASVADPRTGKSYYDGDSAGNSASISAKQVADALNQMRGQYQENIKNGLSPSEAYRALSGDPNGPMVSGALADGKLVQGEKGLDVEKLQKALVAAGARDAEGKEIKPDGDFGSRTKQAVEDYQRKNNLPVTGEADAKLLATLGVTSPQQNTPAPTNPTSPNTPSAPSTPNTPQAPAAPEKLSGTYQEGDSGDTVRKIQERLNERMGLNLATDGKYGPLTEAAVMLYQHQNGLKVDGIAGQDTLAKLNEPMQKAQAPTNTPAATTDTPQSQTNNPTAAQPADTTKTAPAQDGFSLKPGDNGQAVVELQKALLGHGSMCNCGAHGLTTDGKYGPITETAVRDFQLRNDIAPATGIADEKTLKALGLDPKQLQAQAGKELPATDGKTLVNPEANKRMEEVMKAFDTLPAGTFKNDQDKMAKAVEATAATLKGVGDRPLDTVASAKVINGTIYLGDKPEINDQAGKLSMVPLAMNKSIEESAKSINAVYTQQDKPVEIKIDQKAPENKNQDQNPANPTVEPTKPKVYYA
jgi:peptidoglycan hydrolase-like protein with peptidoglycan-binding domain